MNIGDLKIPDDLKADALADGRKLTEQERFRLESLLSYIESPLPKFYGLEQIESQHSLWTSDSAKDYIGKSNPAVNPGIIDIHKTLTIGEAEPDSPIALDYRDVEPRVIYFGDVDYVCCWIELSRDYASLVQLIQKEPA